MTTRERAKYFERLCDLREAYRHLDADDASGTTTIDQAIADAERELDAVAVEAIGTGDDSPAQG